MSDGIRSSIQDELGIEVLSSYNAIETPGVGLECEAHRGYHLNVDLCPVRLVDPRRRAAPPGESGEVVISNLVNRGTILLNYRLGDLAADLPGPALAGGRCRCCRSCRLGRTAWLDLGEGARSTLTPPGCRFARSATSGATRWSRKDEGVPPPGGRRSAACDRETPGGASGHAAARQPRRRRRGSRRVRRGPSPRPRRQGADRRPAVSRSAAGCELAPGRRRGPMIAPAASDRGGSRPRSRASGCGQ